MSSVRVPLSRRIFWLRGLLGLAIAGFLLIGPIVHQTFGIRTDSVYPKWRMFTGKGRDVCQLAYQRVGPEGVRHAVSHLEVLGLDRRKKRVVRIERSQLSQINRAMCRRLARAERNGPSPDLRLIARCGSRGQWVDHSSDGSVCP